MASGAFFGIRQFGESFGFEFFGFRERCFVKRYYPLMAISGLVMAALFALNSSRASDQEAPAFPLPTDEISEVVDLVDRIQELERRLAKLEVREPLVRQADSRESSDFSDLVTRPPSKTPSNGDDDDDDTSQKTNGQMWRFRLLKQRSSRDKVVPAPGDQPQATTNANSRNQKSNPEQPRLPAVNET